MKFLFLAAALVAATPAHALKNDTSNTTDNRGMIIPQPVRYELVFETAKRACPAAYPETDPGVVINNIADRMVFSNDETLLLYNFCIVWVEGRISKK